MRTPDLTALLLGLSGAILYWIGKQTKRDQDQPVSNDGLILPPISVGNPGEVRIASLLSEIDALLQDAGVLDFSARELTTMPEAPGRPVAIPDRRDWPSLVQIAKIAQKIRDQVGPLNVRGYRPSDYNAAVGGAPGSRHQWGQAIDFKISGKSDADRVEVLRLALETAASRPELRMGIGAYGSPPRTVHIDAGGPKNKRPALWGDGPGKALARQLSDALIA